VSRAALFDGDFLGTNEAGHQVSLQLAFCSCSFPDMKFNTARKATKEYARDILSINLFCLMNKSFLLLDVFPKPDRQCGTILPRYSKRMIGRV
jgi:hypothetical protein